MSGGWVFNEKSATTLAAFKEALKNCPKPSPANIWKEVHKSWSESAHLNADDGNVGETEKTVEVRVPPIAHAPQEVEKLEERTVELWLLNCELADSIIDEIRSRSETGDSLLYRTSKIISVVDLDKLVAAACASNEDGFFEKFCAVFLLESIKEKEHCRTIESSLARAFQYNRRAVAESIIAPLLKSDVQRTIVHDFALSLESDDSKFLLTELLNLSALTELQHWHVPILSGLYKRATETQINEVVQAQMVDILKANANTFSKDKTFGKLLLSVILKEQGNIRNLSILESVSLLNDTAFKKPSLAAINKLHQKNT